MKERSIKKRTYYFFDEMINIKDFDSNLLKIDKKSYKHINIYLIGYIAKKDSKHVNIHSVNPLYFIVEKNGNKYLVFASIDKNKEVLGKCTELG